MKGKGRPMTLPPTIVLRQKELEKLHEKIFSRSNGQARRAKKARPEPFHHRIRLTDEEVLEKARAAKNGSAFNKLFGGDWSDYPSQSEADLAFCMILAFWTGKDPAQMDSLFRKSGLCRDKYDERHSSDGQTYGEMTIEKAIEATTKTYQSSLGKLRNTSRRIRPAISTTSESARTSTDKGLTKEIADKIWQDHHFARDGGGLLYHFENGVYLPNGKNVVAWLVRKILEDEGRTKSWSSHRTNEISEYIRVGAPDLWPQPPLNIVNLKNGLLHLDPTPVLKPHTPEHRCSIQLPVVFDPSATCPAWDQFIQEVFPPDAQVLAWEIFAYLMVPEVSIQKAILLRGGGANGKSTFLQGLRSFLGKTNVSSVTLQRLETDKFAVARLVGKLANICADLPNTRLKTASILKAVTGGDDLEAERKFQDSFSFTPFARLIFSTNYELESDEGCDAFYRRMLVIPFARTFSPSEQLPRGHLDTRLASSAELSGLLNRALDVRPQLQARGAFTEGESIKAAWRFTRERPDPVAIWLEKEATEDSEAFVPRGELHRQYSLWAAEQKHPAMSSKEFMSTIRQLRPALTEGQRTVSGRREHVFLGLGLKAETPECTPSHHSHEVFQISQSAGVKGEGENCEHKNENSTINDCKIGVNGMHEVQGQGVQDGQASGAPQMTKDRDQGDDQGSKTPCTLSEQNSVTDGGIAPSKTDLFDSEGECFLDI